MSVRTWLIVGCITDFIIGAGGAVSGAMMQAGTVTLPSQGVWMLGGILGAVAVANHIKAAYNQPPGKVGVGSVPVWILAVLGWAIGWMIS
jgi:hypothetical protein